MRVLVVDDSATMRKMIKRVLGMCGLPLTAFHEAGNGQEALDLLQVTTVDLMLVDVNMPVMDGLTLIERVRGDERYRGVDVLVVSSESSQARIERFASLGAGYIHKPFTPEVFKAALKDYKELQDADTH